MQGVRCICLGSARDDNEPNYHTSLPLRTIANGRGF
jgi:hypothetical protein